MDKTNGWIICHYLQIKDQNFKFSCLKDLIMHLLNSRMKMGIYGKFFIKISSLHNMCVR